MGFFRCLFTVRVEHAYFADGLWKGLDFVPDRETKNLLRGAGLLVRNTGSGVAVYVEVDKTDAMRLYAADTNLGMRLRFKVRCEDRSFENFTDYASQQRSAIPCFDNLDNDGNGVAKRLLSQGEFVSEADFRTIDDLVADEVLGAGERRAFPDFVVTIFKDAEVPEEASEYCIRFNARQSFWKYYLLGNINREQLSIVDLEQRFEFESRGEVMLPGNKPSRVFLSKGPIPFQENSNFRFQLKEPGPGGGRVLIKRLPLAAESRLGKELIDGKREVVLENFVNF